MSEETAGEKTFAPSAKRKADAAKGGDVLRSKELATAFAIVIGAAWLKFAGPWVFASMGESVRAGFTWDHATLDHFDPGPLLASVLWVALPPILLLGCLIIAGSLISQMGFGEGRWVASNMVPKASRLNPASGLKRMFGPNGLIELGKGMAKVTVMGTIAWVWANGHIKGLLLMGRGSLHSQLSYGWDAIISLMFWLSGGLVLIAFVDFPVQFIRRMMRLKMSHQDMRDEAKEQEGSPEKKQAIRQRQREIAMAGVAQAMRKAQFVVTNPTHFSVALSYDPNEAAAPVVLAKGRGDKALAMRELAAELDLPVLEYPALARSLYYTTRERQVIREELYVAVASVLAFVFSLKRGEQRLRPEIDVPVLMRFDADGRLDPKATT